MRKEMLTPSRCREELLERQRISGLMIAVLLFVLVVMWMWIFLIYYMAAPDGIFGNKILGDAVVFTASAVLTVIVVLLFYGLRKRRIRKIQQAVLEIVEDTMLYSYVGEEQRRRRNHTYTYYYYVLVFRYFGHYRIPEYPHYRWSKLYSTDDDEGVYNHAEGGDTFYVVLFRDDKQKEPLLIYNTKHFVYCPDGTKEIPGASWRDSVNLE